MLDEQYITKAQFDEAANAPVTARKHGAEIEVDAPYLADTIYNEMVEIYGKEEAENGRLSGLRYSNFRPSTRRTASGSEKSSRLR